MTVSNEPKPAHHQRKPTTRAPKLPIWLLPARRLRGAEDRADPSSGVKSSFKRVFGRPGRLADSVDSLDGRGDVILTLDRRTRDG